MIFVLTVANISKKFNQFIAALTPNVFASLVFISFELSMSSISVRIKLIYVKLFFFSSTRVLFINTDVAQYSVSC